jgi:hypothetical protein
MRNRHQHRLRGSLVALFVIALCLYGCTRDASLTIEGGNPPTFGISGRSTLESIRVSGPDKEREATRHGTANNSVPYTQIYWEIVPYGELANSSLFEIGPIVYGVVPQGFTQIYPEHGRPPVLVEGDRYNIRISANDGHGVNMFFAIHGGKVFSEGY